MQCIESVSLCYYEASISLPLGNNSKSRVRNLGPQIATLNNPMIGNGAPPHITCQLLLGAVNYPLLGFDWIRFGGKQKRNIGVSTGLAAHSILKAHVWLLWGGLWPSKVALKMFIKF